MVQVYINYEDISISSVEKEDTKYIQKWFNNKNRMIYYGIEDYVGVNEFNEIFLEYYISECEIFLKIVRDGSLIGIFRGRIEFKDENIIWISYFALDYVYLENDEGNCLLEQILNYFVHNYGINNFLVGISDDEKKTLSLLENNGFYILRKSSEFKSGTNTIIMKRKI
jgi:hypothetical protein